MQISIMLFTFSVSDCKCPFRINFVRNVKIVSLTWNLIFRPIRICRIQWCCWLFSFSIRNRLFGGNLVQNVKIVSLRWILISRLIRICRIQWCCSLFCFGVEIPFWRKFGPKCQNYQFKLKLGTETNSNM